MPDDERRSTPHPSAPPEPAELGELTDDAITGSFRILQRKHGHRYSLDDVITAFVAARAMPGAKRCLDLGTGIGSVLLMLAYKLPDARFAVVEAQTNSFRLLQDNVARNDLSARVELVNGDLRDAVGLSPLDGVFELVTGTPPYVPPGQATPSTDAQRAYARQEYRGGVESYLSAAAPVLAAEGKLVVCADARFPERVVGFGRSVGLSVIDRLEIIPRADAKAPLFSVFTLMHTHAASALFVHEPPREASWVARNADGARSQAYLDLRAFFGLAARF